jgi:hypothetical protein
MRKSMWWYFVVAFALVIGAIQSLGWLVRPAAAQSPMTNAPPAAAVGLQCQPTHWRDLVMQQ